MADDLNKGVASWNMGLATAMRLHNDIMEYKDAYINSNPPLMYKLVFSLYLELQSEFTDTENTTCTKLIKTCKESLSSFMRFNKNIEDNRIKYPHRKQMLPNNALIVYTNINDFFLQIKTTMKRLDIHLPKRETDPSSIFGGTD